MSLPILTSDDDVEAIAEYMRTKPNGTTITDAMINLPRTLLEERKLDALVYWDVIKKEGDHIRLSSVGQDLLNTNPDNRYLIYQKLLYQIKPYRSALEWMFSKDFAEITNLEIASHWQMYFKPDLGTSDENQMKSMATCFLNICQASGFGTLTKGRPSQTNLFKINKSILGRFFTETTKIFDKHLNAPRELDLEPRIKPIQVARAPMESEAPVEVVPERFAASRPSVAKIFISPFNNNEIIDQIKTMLEVDKIGYEIATETQAADMNAPSGIFSTMRRCNAGIIFVTVDGSNKRASGKYGIDPEVLIEIGAALTLFDDKVVLVCDSRVEVPPSLAKLSRCEFSGNELSWSAGVNLMKTVTDFVKH